MKKIIIDCNIFDKMIFDMVPAVIRSEFIFGDDVDSADRVDEAGEKKHGAYNKKHFGCEIHVSIHVNLSPFNL